MILRDEKKAIIIKRLKKESLKDLIIDLSITIFTPLFIVIMFSLEPKTDIDILMILFICFLALFVLLQLDELMIAVSGLSECRKIRKTETKCYIVMPAKITVSFWPFHLGRRPSSNPKRVVYMFEGKKYSTVMWVQSMARSGEFRLLLLVPEGKRKKIYAHPLIEYADAVN